MAADTFASWGMEPGQSELACLLVSEVVTNVVLHATASGPLATSSRVPGQEFTVRLRHGASSIWAEVFDYDLRLPRIRSAGENDEGGRGLYLVDQLATRWGSRPTPDGKAVWFEMPVSG